MSKSPLLSIIATNRNDHYNGNQLQRTKFILNYLVNKPEYLKLSNLFIKKNEFFR